MKLDELKKEEKVLLSKLNENRREQKSLIVRAYSCKSGIDLYDTVEWMERRPVRGIVKDFTVGYLRGEVLDVLVSLLDKDDLEMGKEIKLILYAVDNLHSIKKFYE